jgi:AcrR family transcriptional regulator
MTTNLKPEQRKSDILVASLKIAERDGYDRISRKQIAEAAGVSEALVSHHFGTMPHFRRELMRFAVKRQNPRIVLQGLLAKDAQARKAPEDLQDLARKLIA